MPSNLLDLKGPEFLTFYIITLIGLIVILAIARMVVSRLGGKEDIDPKSLSPHELAFLAAGRSRVGESVVAELVHSGSLIPDVGKFGSKWVKTAPGFHAIDESPQSAALTAAEGGATVQKVIQAATAKTDHIAEKLRELGLLAGGAAIAVATFSAICFLSLIGLGIAKISVGLQNHKPIVFLALLLVATTACLIYFSIPIRRTRAGSMVLRKAHTDNAALRTVTTVAANPVSSDDLGLAVAIFGTSVIASSAYGDLNRLLPPGPMNVPQGGSSGCGSTFMASCGGSSSDGGGGRGGGGGGSG